MPITSKTLRAIADQGDITKREERLVLAEVLDRVSRIEARLKDFLNRADVLLSQMSGRKQ